MSTSDERKIGFRRGIRAAVTWLHAFGKGMNDPHAKVVLDLAADRLGSSKLQDISGESPDPTRAALEAIANDLPARGPNGFEDYSTAYSRLKQIAARALQGE